ncbi:MAG: rhomboid family intramembrane serine protease [Desulfobulbaceae bacterium]|nr:rhomboid family intramembrane serine protease [Desulfobulbaceae bacterium]
MTRGSKINSQLCPGCRRLISRDEPACPYCGLKSPGVWWKNSRFSSVLADPDRLVILIIGANIVMFVLALLLNPHGLGLDFNPMGFLAPSNRSLLLLGATGTVPVFQLHRWWSLLTANYLHSGLLHLVFNMLALRQLGPLVTQEYGPYRMVIIYTVSGIGGFFLSLLVGIPLTLGASAAACGLIGAMIYYGKSRGGVYGEAIYRQIGGWAIGIIVFGLVMPGINNWGHVGGMIGGVVLGYLLSYQERRRESLPHRLAGMTCLALSALALTWAVIGSISYLFAT